MLEVFKTVNKINLEFMRDIFEQKSTSCDLMFGNVNSQLFMAKAMVKSSYGYKIIAFKL